MLSFILTVNDVTAVTVKVRSALIVVVALGVLFAVP